MRGSNNEVAVLDAVLGSLSKSPAFAEFEAPTTEHEAVIADEHNVLLARIAEMNNEEVIFIAGDFFREQITLSDSEAAEFSQMERFLNL